MIVAAICLLVGVAIGVIGMGIVASGQNKDCDTCDALRQLSAECAELERRLHGMRSSNGRLGRELQSMAFRNAGFKAR
jgi:hypothetical protein